MAIEYKDYYAILGVAREASDEEVKKAFRRLARRFHPDVAPDKKAAEERFKEINEAYEVLGHPENRRRYDRLGARWTKGNEFRPPPGWDRRSGPRDDGGDFAFRFGGTGFSDFFEAVFGARSRRVHGFEGAADEAPRPDGRVADLESDLLVDLDEVLHGSVRTITQQRSDPIEGKVERISFQVRIPAGVRDGQRIRVQGKGQHLPGGRRGDLFLRVRFARDPDFRVQGLDLHSEIAVAPWEAVLGTTLTTRTLDGPVAFRIPASSKNGQQFRMRGRGLPGPDGTRGDLYLAITVEVPTELTPDEKSLWERLATTSRFQPRNPGVGGAAADPSLSG